MTDEPTTETPREYALVEIFGHRQHYAEISDVERAGAKLLRVHDVDTDEVHFYGGAAIFSMTIISQARIDAHLADKAREKKAREEYEARWKAEREAREKARALPEPERTVVEEESEDQEFDLEHDDAKPF